MPVEHVDRLRAIFNKYAGSHNFHNFTIGKDFRDRSDQRFMKRLTISDPFLVNDTEWVSIKFHGQSFMLHQIRKMIGARPIHLEVDGGSNASTVALVAEAGANVIVAGSGVFKGGTYTDNIAAIRKNAERARAAAA